MFVEAMKWFLVRLCRPCEEDLLFTGGVDELKLLFVFPELFFVFCSVPDC